jgi:hypothetical protein
MATTSSKTRRPFGKTRVEHREQGGELRPAHEVGELLVVGGLLGVPPVLEGHRHDDLVEQRVAQPGDLREGSGAAVRVVVANEILLPAGRRVDADPGDGVGRIAGAATTRARIGDPTTPAFGKRTRCQLSARYLPKNARAFAVSVR